MGEGEIQSSLFPARDFLHKMCEGKGGKIYLLLFISTILNLYLYFPTLNKHPCLLAVCSVFGLVAELALFHQRDTYETEHGGV